MTSQNQQPQRPFPPDQPPGHSTDLNSSWAPSQSMHTNPAQAQYFQSSGQPYQGRILTEQKGPGWSTPSRTMLAKQHQQEIRATQVPALL